MAYVRQRAGVTNGAFYYHFDSKDALAVAVIDQFQITIRDAESEVPTSTAAKPPWSSGSPVTSYVT